LNSWEREVLPVLDAHYLAVAVVVHEHCPRLVGRAVHPDQFAGQFKRIVVPALAVNARELLVQQATQRRQEIRDQQEMTMAVHSPLKSSDILSLEKMQWWHRQNPPKGGKLANPKVALLVYVASTTPRPTDPTESILNGYVRLEKLHDHEPQALVDGILRLDPNFFDEFPNNGFPESAPHQLKMRAAVGEALRSFIRLGLPTYDQPGLRTQTVPVITDTDNPF